MKPNRSVFLQTDFFIPILEYVGVKERGVAARGYFCRSLSANRFKNMS